VQAKKPITDDNGDATIHACLKEKEDEFLASK
jgi:hypothetical protein